MTDHELTELAAKAADIPGEWIEHATEGWGFFQLTGGGHWSPLADDGDALRLAVKLRMLVDADGSVYAVATATPKGTGVMMHEKHRDDPYAAVRRAIVRAAAEIGKESK